MSLEVLPIRVAHNTAPSGLYLATKQSITPALESVVPGVPDEPWLKNVAVPMYSPVTSTLPDGSVAILCPMSLPVPAIRAAHKTAPAEEYLATKQSSSPAFESVIAAVPDGP